MTKENILGKLSESEAAKRLAIGTKIGKYHDKAMQIKGLSVDDFNQAKSKFIEILKNIKFSEESGQEPSSISLET